MTLRYGLAAILFACIIAAPAHAAIYTVGPGGPFAGCTHTTLQSAVNAAALHAGADEIHVAMVPDGYPMQAVVVDSQDVAIIGGYANCFASVPTGRTRLSGAGGAAAPVLTVSALRSTVQVRLDRLELVDGDNPSGSGGGLRVDARGTISLSRMLVADNIARAGGGIAVSGPAGDSKTRLLIGDDVLVRDNIAAFGGGIHVSGAYLRLDGLGTRVQGNRAEGVDTQTGLGGGILIAGSGASIVASADIGSGGDSRIGTVVGNRASVGAGMFVDDFSDIRLFTSDMKRPVRVHFNHASAFGGAVYARGFSTRIGIFDGSLDSNSAEYGGGALVAEDGAQISMRPSRNGDAPVDAVTCLVASACNRISGNVSVNGGILPKGGAVAMVGNGNRIAETRVMLDSVVLSGNIGVSLFAGNCIVWPGFSGCDEPASIDVVNSLVAPNVDSASVFASWHHTRFRCFLCTIADIRGPIVNDESVPFLFDTNGELELAVSIVWEPGRSVLGDQHVPTTLVAHDLIVHDATAFVGQARVRTDDPRFADQPVGDYHLSALSPAIDSASPAGVPTFDLDGRIRAFDVAGVADLEGIVDLGAYEYSGD